MTRARSNTAIYLRIAATSLAYLAAFGTAVALTRFGGGSAFLWGANAVLLAALISTSRRHWAALILSCWASGAVAAGIWGLGWGAAPFIATVNVAEPVIGALLIRRWGIHRSALDSARDLTLFILAAGIVAPASTGLVGAGLISILSRTDYSENYWHWLVGHGLGALTFTPIFAQVANGEIARWVKSSTASQKGEAALLLILTAFTSIAVFAQSRLPLLFLPILPLMLVTFRVGGIGASLGVAIITLAGMGFTLNGLGPVNLIEAPIGDRLQFIQFYLAATVMVVLPVAADLAHRGRLFERLRDSEARFRLLTENSTDIVLNLDVNGIIRYASPSITLLGGYDAQQIVGRVSSELIDPEDHEQVFAVHLEALAHPEQTFTVEYRGIINGGERRWFETHTRAVVDEAGVVQGVVSAVRDTSARRRTEAELSRAANTDPLTGLCNRRAFDRTLDQHLGDGTTIGGCLAIFDLDHFKRINDRYGHATGDEILRLFARMAEAQTRGDDMFARIGGEEFGLLLPGLSAEQAQWVCERIRKSVETNTTLTSGEAVTVTVSVGITAIAEGDTPAIAMRRADEALYASKRLGRNRASLVA